MNQHQSTKAPYFRGYVRKSVSPQGEVCWAGEVRTAGVFTDLGLTQTVGEAIARAIEKAQAPAPVKALAPRAEPLRQVA